MKRAIKLGISIGDINGIGLEVILKTFKDKRMFDFCTPIVFAEFDLVQHLNRKIGLDDKSFRHIHSLKDTTSKKINVINCWQEKVVPQFGQNTKEGGKYAFLSLQSASDALKSRDTEALVTAPINKDNIQSEQFNFPGHTEFLENQHQGSSIMLMLSEHLRMGVVTGHIPLEKVAQHLNHDVVVKKINLFHLALKQDFGIRKPKIAVLGLNPHAGDNGLIGKEEQTIIEPAIKTACEQGILAFGPYSADSFFDLDKLKAYDGVLAMYHDQGLIPFKTLSFGNGVNFTAGLSVIRTSPDHGTGYDIAGTNNANESSFRQAVYTAYDIVKKRSEWKTLNQNPLPKFEKK